MDKLSPSELTERIVEKAKSPGVSAVGVAEVTGTYQLRATSFESVSTGAMDMARK